MLRTNVNEVNIQPVDLGDEVRQSFQSRLALAPIVVRAPLAREFLNRRELDALRCIRDRFPLRPPGGVHAPAQFRKFRVRKIHLKRANGGVITARLLCNFSHSFRPSPTFNFVYA